MINESPQTLGWSRGTLAISRAVPEHRPSSIAVADADPHLRDIYRTLLQFHGHRVLDATDGLEAVELVRSQHPDVLLVDADLPYIDGFDTAQILHANATTASTAIVLLSNHACALEQMRALRAGCAGYLGKPFEPRDLLAEVGRALAGNDVPTPVATPAPIR